jgi:hypothetical protein
LAAVRSFFVTLCDTAMSSSAPATVRGSLMASCAQHRDPRTRQPRRRPAGCLNASRNRERRPKHPLDVRERGTRRRASRAAMAWAPASSCIHTVEPWPSYPRAAREKSTSTSSRFAAIASWTSRAAVPAATAPCARAIAETACAGSSCRRSPVQHDPVVYALSAEELPPTLPAHPPPVQKVTKAPATKTDLGAPVHHSLTASLHSSR